MYCLPMTEVLVRGSKGHTLVVPLSNRSTLSNKAADVAAVSLFKKYKAAEEADAKPSNCRLISK